MAHDNPPILGIVCEVSFTGGHFTEETPDSLQSRLRDGYPVRVDPESASRLLPTGVLRGSGQDLPDEAAYASADQSRMLLLGEGRLVLVQVHPYAGFATWRGDLLEACRHLSKVTGGRAERLSFTYTNRLVVPGVDVDVTRWFRRLSDAVLLERETVTGVPWRFELPTGPEGHRLQVGIDTEEPTQEHTTVALFELRDLVELNGDDLELRLNEAHAELLNAFELVVTDKAREMFHEAGWAILHARPPVAGPPARTGHMEPERPRPPTPPTRED